MPPRSQAVAKAPLPASATRFRIGALLCFRDAAGRILLIERARQPNQGLWCAVGGKLEMPTGESPYECAVREAREEVGAELSAADLRLRCILSEKDYERVGHWLMFVFEVAKPLAAPPPDMAEGRFGFFALDELPGLPMPPLDRAILLERVLGGPRDALHVLRADAGAARDPERLREEERIGGAP